MKDNRVDMKLLTCLLPSDEPPEFTTFPGMKKSPSTLLLHVEQLPASQITNLYATSYHLAVLMMKTSLQFIAHLTLAPHYH